MKLCVYVIHAKEVTLCLVFSLMVKGLLGVSPILVLPLSRIFPIVTLVVIVIAVVIVIGNDLD